MDMVDRLANEYLVLVLHLFLLAEQIQCLDLPANTAFKSNIDLALYQQAQGMKLTSPVGEFACGWMKCQITWDAEVEKARGGVFIPLIVALVATSVAVFGRHFVG